MVPLSGTGDALRLVWLVFDDGVNVTDEEDFQISSCGRGCGVIGGPWIDHDPACPFHGHEARLREDEHEEVVELRVRVAALLKERDAIAALLPPGKTNKPLPIALREHFEDLRADLTSRSKGRLRPEAS